MLAVAADCGVILGSIHNMDVVNAAFDSGDNVVIIFSVFRSDSYQAMGQLLSPLGDEDVRRLDFHRCNKNFMCPSSEIDFIFVCAIVLR